MMESETTLAPRYDRINVAEVYDRIEKDLEAALPYVSDQYYTVPKYHFNKKAAYAFAARFYLYYGKLDKSVRYATECLGSEPAAMLRDWEYQAKMTQKYDPIVEHYIDASLNCNLLLMTAYSKMGLAFGPYYVYSRYAHGNYLASTETGEAIPNLWNGSNRTYWMGMKEYEATNLDKTIFWKLPYLFEYTDPVARIGYYRTVYPAFAADQVLLERAEANTLLENYDAALADMNLWIKNIASGDEEHLPRELDLDRVNSWFNDTPYHVWDTSRVKKHLHPKFIQLEEGTTKENMASSPSSGSRPWDRDSVGSTSSATASSWTAASSAPKAVLTARREPSSLSTSVPPSRFRERSAMPASLLTRVTISKA